MKTPKRVRLAAIILFFQALFLTFVFTIGLYVWWLVNRTVNEIEAFVDDGVRAVGAELGDEVSAAVVGYVPPAADWPFVGLIIRQLLGVQQLLLPVMIMLAILIVVAYATSIGVWRRRRWAFLAVLGIAVVYFFLIIPPVGAFFMLFFTIPLVTPKSIKAFWGESGLNKAALQQVGNSAVQRGEQLRDQISESERLKQAGNSALKYGGQMRESVQTNESFQRFGAVTRDYADQVGRKLIKTDEVTADPEKVDIISDDRDVISAETPAPSHDNHTEPDLDSHTYPADTETDQAASGKQEAP